MKKAYIIYIVIFAVIILTFLIFGARIGTLIAGIFGAGAGMKKRIEDQNHKISDKEDEYESAGDDIEAKKHTDHQSAANTIDDILDDSDS